MLTIPRLEILKRFQIERPVPTAIVNLDLIPAYAPSPLMLRGYHPEATTLFGVTAVIISDGTGAPNNRDAILKIVPHRLDGNVYIEATEEKPGSWNISTIKLLKLMDFVPTHSFKLDYRDNALMMRPIADKAKLKLDTHWALTTARLEKSRVGDKFFNDVILFWEYTGPESNPKFLDMAVTSWKW